MGKRDKKIKKFLVPLVALMVFAGMIPATAHTVNAEEDCYLCVGRMMFAENGNQTGVPVTGVSFDRDTSTLTLKGTSIKGTAHTVGGETVNCGILYNGAEPLTIKIIGANKVTTGEANEGWNSGIMSYRGYNEGIKGISTGAIEVRGDSASSSKLSINTGRGGTKNCGISAGDLKIKRVTLDSTANSAATVSEGIDARCDCEITDNSAVKAGGSGAPNSAGIAVYKDNDANELTIEAYCSLTAIGKALPGGSGYGVRNEADFNMEGGILIASGSRKALWNRPVSADGRLKIKGGANASSAVLKKASSYNYGDKYIKINSLLNPELKISKQSYRKIYGNSAFKLGVTADSPVKYKSNNSSVAAVGRSGKVTVKGAGKAIITAVAVENEYYYSTSNKLSVTVVPSKAVISSVKAGQKKMTVKMKKKASAYGGSKFQIQYRAKGKSKWKTVKTSRQKTVIKNLKKNKSYQIRARAYKSNYYGVWSKKKTSGKIKR